MRENLVQRPFSSWLSTLPADGLLISLLRRLSGSRTRGISLLWERGTSTSLISPYRWLAELMF